MKSLLTWTERRLLRLFRKLSNRQNFHLKAEMFSFHSKYFVYQELKRAPQKLSFCFKCPDTGTVQILGNILYHILNSSSWKPNYHVQWHIPDMLRPNKRVPSGKPLRHLNFLRASLILRSEILCLQVRAPHYSSVLSPSFIFSCTTIANFFSYFKCIVSYCCSRENETWRQYPWKMRGFHL